MQAYFLPMDPSNLLCQAAKWRASDVSASTGGDMAAGPVWGHFTMFNLRPQDTAEIDEIYAAAPAS